MTSTAEAPEELPRPVLPALPSDVHHESILHLMTQALVGQNPEVHSTMSGRRQFNNMVRLMDKTVIEYESARAHCEDWVRGIDETGARFSCYFRAIDHMETCIGALHRTFLHLERISQMPAAPPVDRTARRTLRAAITEVNEARDWIEHADRRMSMAEDGVALPVVNLLTGHVSVGDASIAYVDLARWIHQTFKLVRMLLDETPTGKTA